MKNEEVENMLSRMEMPEPQNLMSQGHLKIPLLSFRKSSRTGLWLLIVPLVFAITLVLKSMLGVNPVYLDVLRRFFAYIDDNPVLTYLIPIIFVGLPLFAMVINLLAICHFERNRKLRELLITIKYRPLNIIIILFSFALLIFFLLPDKLAF